MVAPPNIVCVRGAKLIADNGNNKVVNNFAICRGVQTSNVPVLPNHRGEGLGGRALGSCPKMQVCFEVNIESQPAS